ncbi:MAG: 2-isopropylmalate synthase [Armatimonadetes bacterium]|nr:2-isopropylmalate synthase [Armatimonadota bacterium]
MSKQVLIFDTTLRDGEQSPGVRLNMEQKLEIAHALRVLGVNIIEAGFPISSPGDFESVNTLAREIKGVTICGLTRAREKDIDVAAEALAPAESRRIHTGLGVSQNHLVNKLRMSKEEALAVGVAAVKHATKYTDDIEYFMEDSGRAELDYVYKVTEEVIRAGATTINVPDTTGFTFPAEYQALIKGIIENVPNSDKAVFSCHCHNDLGMATANTLAGVMGGARQVEVTINGIGERAGNTALEEVVMAMFIRKDYTGGLETSIDTTKLLPLSRMVPRGAWIQFQRCALRRDLHAILGRRGQDQRGRRPRTRTSRPIIRPRLPVQTSDNIEV